MRYPIIISCLLLATIGISACQSKVRTYVSNELGFQYTPPGNLADITASRQEDTKRRAAEAHTSNVMPDLLVLVAQTEDTDPEWQMVSIVTYPREKIQGNDSLARIVMSGFVAGRQMQGTGTPTQQTIAGQLFNITHYVLQEGKIQKHALVYVSILGKQMVAFVFSGNSEATVTASAKTMSTLKLK